MVTLPAQIFSWTDAPLVALILILELLLAADNAAVLAMIVRNLPPRQQKSALFVGIFSAFLLRMIGVVFAAILIHLFWMQIVGGLYLMYIAWKFIFKHKTGNHPFAPKSYWKAVAYIEVLDLLFAIDSILGAFALTGLYYPFSMISSKLWVIYLGGILGVVAIRLVTGTIIKLLDRYSCLERIIFLIIGWMGLKLVVEAIFPGNHILDLFFWVGTLFVVLIGFLSRKR